MFIDVMLIVLSLSMLLSGVLVLRLNNLITELRKQIAEVLVPYEMEEEHDSFSDENETISREEMTEYEIKRQQREEDFDQRILQIKEELDSQMPDQHKGHDADILHPGIENLPHDSIRNYQTNPPDIEYAD